MVVDALTEPFWPREVTGAVGELDDISTTAVAAVVLPGPSLELPTSTLRNLRSTAILRLRSGPIWVLSVTGHRWTAERLALLADLLHTCDAAGPDAILMNRVNDELGLPGIQIVLPTMAYLEGISWNVRPLAVAIGLAQVFAGGCVARGAITGADVDALVAEVRCLLNCALARFRARLDSAALARCQGYGDSALCVYNYLAAGEHSRNRMQFAVALPVFLQAVASGNANPLYGEMRSAVDEGRPLAALVCKASGTGPAVFRALVGVSVDTCGARWLGSPIFLMRLMGGLRPDRRPERNRDAWSALNRLVEHAESVTGSSIEQSLAGQAWLREAMNARGGVREGELAPEIDPRAAALVEAFREDLYALLGANQMSRARLAISTWHLGLRQDIDHWLLQRTRKQLCALAACWDEVYAAERAEDAGLIACMRGQGYWGLLPAPMTSADGCRRFVPLVSRQQLVDFGTAMSNCLEAAYLQSYDAACRSGGTFLVGLVDGVTGAPRSTAEFKVGRIREGTKMAVELVQHTARKNVAPSQSCVTAMRELLRHVDGDSVQLRLRIGVTAVRAMRRNGASAISATQRETRLRALRRLLGDQTFAAFWQLCAQAQI